MIKKFIIFIALCLLVLLIWMSNNLVNFTSKQITVDASKDVFISQDAIENLSESISYKTISYDDSSDFDAVAFLSFHKFLKRTYPLTFSSLSERIFSDYSILLQWEAEEDLPLNPVLIMAHMDVVPADDIENWSENPFSGAVKDNHVWGRGALDDKSSLMAILESVEYLLSNNFTPKRDIYFSLGHDEENTGQKGNAIIANTLAEEGIYFEFVLDEGSIVTEGIFSDIDSPVAIIGVAEKGYVTIELTSEYKSGHSSMPGNITTIGKLAKAINNLQRYQMPSELISPIKYFIEFIGPELGTKERFIFSNSYLLSSTILSKWESISPAMVRTTMAPTIISGGNKSNILPYEAKATINFRIRQGNNVDDVKEHVIKTINDNDITVSVVDKNRSSNPSKVSSINSPSFNMIHKTIKERFPDVIVAPGLVLGATDSRHFQNISKDIYRFIPVKLSSSELSMFHGHNEKISVTEYLNMIQFYIQLIQNINAS